MNNSRWAFCLLRAPTGSDHRSKAEEPWTSTALPRPPALEVSLSGSSLSVIPCARHNRGAAGLCWSSVSDLLWWTVSLWEGLTTSCELCVISEITACLTKQDSPETRAPVSGTHQLLPRQAWGRWRGSGLKGVSNWLCWLNQRAKEPPLTIN